MDAAATLMAARERAGLSRRALARLAGTSPATLAAYETGAKVPAVDTMDRIVRAAGLDLSVELARVADRGEAARVAKGRELQQVLDLAGAFPARHHPSLRFPPLHRAVGVPS